MLRPSPSAPCPAARSVARAAGFAMLAAVALAAQVPARFTLGDTREEVRAAQGTPQVIERLASQGVEHWSWDAASVTFDAASGRVIEWNDPQRQLRTTLRASRTPPDSALSLGDSLADVARHLGTPWAVTRDGTRRQLYLAYGRSIVRVDVASRRVTGWVRRDAAMRVNPADDSLAHAALSVAPTFTAAPSPGSSSTPGSRLVLSRVLVRDVSGDGRLAPREFADIIFRLRNDGPTATPALPAHVVRSPGLVLLAGAPDTLWLAPVAPADSIDISITAYATGTVPFPELALVILTPGTAARFASRIATAPAQADSTRRTAAERPPLADRNPDALAVVIGVDEYLRLPEARYAASDAALVRSYLTRTLGVPEDNLHLAFRTGASASGSELRRLLGDQGWLARRANDNSDIVVYFAGHGALDEAQRTPFLLPSDADANYVSETGIDLHALFDRLARLKARSITVILDACFSGLSRSGRPLVAGTRAAVVSIEHPALVRQNMAVFVASRGAQLAGDLPDVQHGAFTWYLTRGLQGAADDDRDGTITVRELGRFVEAGVSQSAAAHDREQQPVTIARDSLRAIARLARP